MVEFERADTVLASANEPDFLPLPVDPLPEHRSWLGPRAVKLLIPIGLLALVALWIVAERMLMNNDSWPHWDIVWYAAGGLTLIATGVLAAVLWMQSRAQGGLSQAIAWLFS